MTRRPTTPATWRKSGGINNSKGGDGKIADCHGGGAKASGPQEVTSPDANQKTGLMCVVTAMEWNHWGVHLETGLRSGCA
jgi:hypothetical protein